MASMAERNSSSRVRPVKRPLVPQLLTFIFTFLQPATLMLLSTLKEQPMKAATRKHPYAPSSITPPPPTPPPRSPSPSRQLDNIFIDALAQACSGQLHVRTWAAQAIASNPGYMYHKARRKNAFNAGRQIRHSHRATMPPCPPVPLQALSRDDYLSILDYYRRSYHTNVLDLVQLPSAVPMRFSLQSGRYISPPPEAYMDADELSLQAREHIRDGKSPALTHLLEVLVRDECTHEEAFEAYSALPYPGVSHLSPNTRRLLLRRLSVMERKSRISKMRYLSVLDDMKSTGLPITQAEWNSALAFCGQCLTRLTAVDVENALRTWKEMEQEANVKGGTVTFNILFDMAAKAEKFVLAEMILKEMGDRNVPFNRYSRTAFIFYHGLKGDGDGVRGAYREFVESGEIVDTVVLNCVITSLLRAGEPGAAEQVYERMKRMHTKQTGRPPMPPTNWREVRHLGHLLDRAAQRFRDDPEKLRQIREEQSIAPDVHTYAHLVEYHVCQTGELPRIAALLAEMQHFGLPMHGRIFTKLFKGFTCHGGVPYTSWTRERLEAVWDAMLKVLDCGSGDVHVMKWMVVWAVQAFRRCFGRGKALEIWHELKKRWKPVQYGDWDFVITTLQDILHVDRDQL